MVIFIFPNIELPAVISETGHDVFPYETVGMALGLLNQAAAGRVQKILFQC
jgi:hypothetical protein